MICSNKYRAEHCLPWKGGASLLIWMFFITWTAQAQIQFNSKKLEQIFNLIPVKQKQEIERQLSWQPGTYLFDAAWIDPQSRIEIRINKYREIEHIGLGITDDHQNSLPFREVLDYLGRIFLVTSLSKEQIPFAREMKENGIEVRYNGQIAEQSHGPQLFRSIVIRQETPVRYRYDANYFKVEWVMNSSDKLEIKFPNNYSLITDKSKDELELELLRELKSTHSSSIDHSRPSENQLTPISQNLYLFQGDNYLSVNEFSSSKYFAIHDSVYPVFSNSHFEESFRNLFLNLIPTTLDICVTQKLYGGNVATYKMNLNSFLGYFSSNHTLYFGWQNRDKSNLKASILICNSVYGYNHLIEISASADAVFKPNGEVNGVFYSFIPKYNFNQY